MIDQTDKRDYGDYLDLIKRLEVWGHMQEFTNMLARDLREDVKAVGMSLEGHGVTAEYTDAADGPVVVLRLGG